jgi:hypothetical protein
MLLTADNSPFINGAFLGMKTVDEKITLSFSNNILLLGT